MVHHVPNLGAVLHHTKIPVSTFFLNAFLEVVKGLNFNSLYTQQGCPTQWLHNIYILFSITNADHPSRG
jgi:hypothetical protein